MGELLLGIDIGTSSCKAAVFQTNGQAVAAASAEYAIYRPGPGFAEQNPEEWWQAACQAVRECMEKGRLSPKDVAGIGVDGQSWSAVAVDRHGEVLANTPIWMDTRSDAICQRLNHELGENAFFQVSGNPLTAPYTTGKVLWYKEELPEVYRHTSTLLQCNSFIVYRLTETASQDVSQGYGWHCFDIRNGSWDDAMRKTLDIPESFLPPIHLCHEIVGTVTKKAAGQCGLLEGTPVVAGGLDAACGTLGAGVIHDGETQEQGGQAGGMSICTQVCRTDPRLILGFHAVPGHWLVQGGTTGGGGVMRWLEREFADHERAMAVEKGKSSLVQFNELAEKISPGSDGLIFLPYMAGERTPIWDPKAKGIYYGLDFEKTKGHFIRAAMEGVGFSLRHNLETAEDAGVSVGTLRAMGGSANSLLWTQIKSDITGKPILVPASDTATTLGAAMLAGVGVGLYQGFEEAVSRTTAIRREHKPSQTFKAIYDRNYEIYLELYEKLKETMHR